MKNLIGPLEYLTASDEPYRMSFGYELFEDLDCEMFHDFVEKFKHRLEYYFSGDTPEAEYDYF